jgi:hypothetical protein
VLYSKFYTPSMDFAYITQARLLLVHLAVVSFNEAAGFTLCYGLLICSHPFGLLCHRASTLGFLHQLPVSYETTWLLPRLDFHQLAINGLLGTHNRKKASKQRLNAFLLFVYRLATTIRYTWPSWLVHKSTLSVVFTSSASRSDPS